MNAIAELFLHGAAQETAYRVRLMPSEVKVPARSTIHAMLDRHGLVTRARRSRTHTEGTPLSEGLQPNALWCTDYKGEFLLGDRRYCYPLTVRNVPGQPAIPMKRFSPQAGSSYLRLQVPLDRAHFSEARSMAYPAKTGNQFRPIGFEPSVAAQRNRRWLLPRKFIFEFTGQLVYVRCFTK
jgi:hypothetical protein